MSLKLYKAFGPMDLLCLQGKHKKSFFLNFRGEGCKGPAIREKHNFFFNLFFEGGWGLGVKALMARPLKKDFFCGFHYL